MFVLGLLSAACSGDAWLFVGLVAFPKHPLDDVQRPGDTDGLGRNLSKRTPSAVPLTTVLMMFRTVPHGSEVQRGTL